jgi:thiol-disulfide isomerase/thioredoxin
MKHLLILFLLLNSFSRVDAQNTPLHADEVIKQASAQALKENKKVFLIYHASWCGWCHKMDTSLNDPSVKKFFDDNYVIRHLTIKESPQNKHLENPGAEALLEKYKGTNQGIPYWLIFDAQGNLLADSQERPDGAALNTKGKNTGCPASKEEVDHFIKVLRKTSPLNEEALEKIRVRFRRNERS